MREMNPPGQSCTEALHTVTLLIYIREMNPPGQLITEALYTPTLLIYIYKGDEPSGHSSTEALRTVTLHIYIYIYIYIYKGDELPWSIDNRGLSYHYTAYIYKGDDTPWSIDHRGFAYHYTAYIYICHEGEYNYCGNGYISISYGIFTFLQDNTFITPLLMMSLCCVIKDIIVTS